jgi:hypothetical protein
VLNVGLAPFAIPMIPLEIVDTYLPIAVGASASDIAALLRGEAAPGEARDGALLHLALVGFAALATAALLVVAGSVATRVLDEARRRHVRAADATQSGAGV